VSEAAWPEKEGEKNSPVFEPSCCEPERQCGGVPVEEGDLVEG